MNDYQKQCCQTLTQLMGYKTYTKYGRRCRGKWSGTTDYFLALDNKVDFAVSNGMKHFYEKVSENIDFLTQFNTNRENMLQYIQEQVIIDNIIAQREGLLPLKVKDIVVNKTATNYLLWSYLLLEVDNHTFRFIESGLNYAIRSNTLSNYFDNNRHREIFTAGAVKSPTFVFCNTRFSHLDNIHKLKTI